MKTAGNYIALPIKQIILLVPGFPENERDSVCTPALQDFVRIFARQFPQVQVTVIAFQYPFQRKFYRWHGISVYALGGQNRGKLFRLLTWGRAIRTFQRLHRYHSFDVIHSFWLSESAVVGQWLSRWYGIPHVATIMGQDARENNVYLKWIDSPRTTVVAISSFVAGVFRQNFREHAQAIIPFGVSEIQLRHLPANPLTRDIDILGVGSLIPLKNFDDFVEVIRKIVPQYPQLKCLLIGDGPRRTQLQDMISRYHLDRHVQLLGELPRQKVYELMARSRVLLHPSKYESQGYVFMEALALGMKVVGRNVGYLPYHPGVFICHSREALVSGTLAALHQNGSFGSQQLRRMENTVQDYWKLYLRIKK